MTPVRLVTGASATGASSVSLPLEPAWLRSPEPISASPGLSHACTVPSRDLGGTLSSTLGSSVATALPDSARLDSGCASVQDFQRAMADAVPLMKSPASLGYAFLQLQTADALHGRLLGRPSASALRKMAICLASAAAAELRRRPPEAHWYDVSPGLPPTATGKTGRALAEARADLALAFLNAAVDAGSEDPLADQEWAVLAELRPVQFAAVAGRMQSGALRRLGGQSPR